MRRKLLLTLVLLCSIGTTVWAGNNKDGTRENNSSETSLLGGATKHALSINGNPTLIGLPAPIGTVALDIGTDNSLYMKVGVGDKD